MGYIVTVVVAAALLAAFFARTRLDRVTIFDYERALRYVNGQLDGVLGPGRYWIYRPSTTIVRVDVRPSFVSISGQEVLSSDGISIRMSLAAEYAIADPVVALNQVSSYDDALYVTLQLALRELIGGKPIEDLLEQRGTIGARLLAGTKEAIAGYGIDLRSVEVKDVMFTGDLKRVFAQVVQARKEGEAALEKARAETAALRNLANAARLVEASPALLQLRLLQQIAGSNGNTIVLGLPASATPLPVKLPTDVRSEPHEVEPPDVP